MERFSRTRKLWPSVLAFIIIGGLAWGIQFYPILTFSTFLPSLLFFISITNYFLGKEKMKKDGSGEWFMHYNMIIAIFGIICAFILSIYFLISIRGFLLLKVIIMILLSLYIAIPLLYALVYYRRQRKV